MASGFNGLRDGLEQTGNYTDLNLIVKEPSGDVRYHVMGGPAPKNHQQLVGLAELPIEEVILGRNVFRDADAGALLKPNPPPASSAPAPKIAQTVTYESTACGACSPGCRAHVRLSVLRVNPFRPPRCGLWPAPALFVLGGVGIYRLPAQAHQAETRFCLLAVARAHSTANPACDGCQPAHED